MSDRFDLEQQIFDCWDVTKDIQTILDNWDGLDEDGKMNCLIGIRYLYELKFKKLQDIFEQVK